MKNLFIIILMLLCTSIFSQTYSVVGSSFTDSVPIQSSSAQWVDLGHPAGISNDSVRLYISHVFSNGRTSYPQQIYKVSLFDFLYNLPHDTITHTTRIYFNMPQSYANGKFQITSASGAVFGIFTDTSSMPSYLSYITNPSFDSIIPVHLQTFQHADIHIDNISSFPSDTLALMMCHIDSSGSLIDTLVLNRIQTLQFFTQATGHDSSSNTKGFYFNMPNQYPVGLFCLISTANTQNVYGKIYDPNAPATAVIDVPISNSEPVSYRYYDFSGREVSDDRGLLIRETLYRDGTVTRSKIYRQSK